MGLNSHHAGAAMAGAGLARRLARRDARYLVLLGWVLLVLVFFSASGGKRGVYILPAVPALVLATAPLVPGLLRLRCPRRLCFALVVLLAAAAGAGASMALASADPAIASLRLPLALLAVGLLAGGVWAGLRRAPVALAGALAAFWTVIGLAVYPALDPIRSGRRLMHTVAAEVGADDALAIVGWREQMILQATQPITHFGYRTQVAEQARAAALWLAERGNGARALVPARALTPCFAAERPPTRSASSPPPSTTRAGVWQGFLERERTFSADASHQLRTSVAAITSTVELLLADPGLPATACDRLRRLAQAAAHLSHQIEGFLFLAREPQAHDLAPCSVAEAVEALIARERVLLPADEPVIRFDRRAQPTVEAPEATLDIVVGNLLRNAIAHGRGPIKVATLPDGVEVVDHGPVVPAETLARVFERGFRGNGAVPGNGLGLAIARRVADRYGWRIDLASTPETGTVSRVGFGT